VQMRARRWTKSALVLHEPTRNFTAAAALSKKNPDRFRPGFLMSI